MKQCPRCGIIKSLTDYHTAKGKRTGVQTFCKLCQNIGRKKSYYKNREQVIRRQAEYGTKYFKHKYNTDPIYKLNKILRGRMYSALKSNKKTRSAVEDLGCSGNELKKYIESKWKPGMNWSNWSRYGWHIDHIRPIHSFDLSDQEQWKLACHYTNLQPLWCEEHKLKTALENR